MSDDSFAVNIEYHAVKGFYCVPENHFWYSIRGGGIEFFIGGAHKEIRSIVLPLEHVERIAKELQSIVEQLGVNKYV